ncbi:cell division protein PerM [Streptomyces sp. NBC_00388]|uniref:cell division protein PerM n=1 Tax=Streptomyces sp. NBC_00388 TaxID=2975735 RepID=UPI002E1E1CCF
MARVTLMTDRSPSLAPVRSRSAVLADCVLRGGLAAALGLGSLTVLVMLLWISSPYPDSGPGGALHVTAALWLLAHGAELTRHETASGVAAPLGVVPMLLVVLPVWLVQRAARAAFDPANGRPGPSPLGALCAVTSGYLLVAAVAALYAAGGPMSVAPVSALWHLPLTAGAAAGVGVWRARDFPREPFSGWGRMVASSRAALPAGVWRAVRSPRVPTALRAGAAGAAVLAGGGALLVGGSLVWHGGAAQESFLRLTGSMSGRFTVLLLAAALVPNAAVWGASYALGPGFTLGAGAAVTPLLVTGNAALPYFPLLAALPGPGSGSPLNWAVAGVPLTAGLLLGCFATRVRENERPETLGGTALTALSAAVVCAAVMAAAAALSGGPLGTGRLTSFGPVWWQTSVAGLAWTVTTGLPVALIRRWWVLRSHRAAEAGPAVVAAVPVEVPVVVKPLAVEVAVLADAPAAGGPEVHSGAHGGADERSDGWGAGSDHGGAGAGRWAALRSFPGRLLAKFPLTDAQDRGADIADTGSAEWSEWPDSIVSPPLPPPPPSRDKAGAEAGAGAAGGAQEAGQAEAGTDVSRSPAAVVPGEDGQIPAPATPAEPVVADSDSASAMAPEAAAGREADTDAGPAPDRGTNRGPDGGTDSTDRRSTDKPETGEWPPMPYADED